MKISWDFIIGFPKEKLKINFIISEPELQEMNLIFNSKGSTH